MTTKRIQNCCEDCGDTWYPRGRDLSRSCPNCGSGNVKYLGCCGCAIIKIVGMLFLALVVVSIMLSYCQPKGGGIDLESSDMEKVSLKRDNTQQTPEKKPVNSPPNPLKPSPSTPSDEEGVTLGPPIPGVRLEKLEAALGLIGKGFVIDQNADGKALKVFRLTNDEGEYLVAFEGLSERAISKISAEITRSKYHGINNYAKSFFESIASLGSSSEGAVKAKKWVGENVGVNAETEIGGLVLKLRVNSVTSQTFEISSPVKTE